MSNYTDKVGGWQLESYTLPNGIPRKIMLEWPEDWAAFYRPFHDDWTPEVFDNHWWNSSITSSYIPHRFSNSDGARAYIQDFKLPDKLNSLIRKYSSRLNSILNTRHTPQSERFQRKGRFDCGAMGRVITDIQSNRFSNERTLPFKARIPKPRKRPHIAIVAQANASLMWDPEYIPRVAALAISVSEACAANGCEITAGLMRNTLTLNGNAPLYQEQGILLAAGNRTARHNHLAVFLHRELFRVGRAYAKVSCPRRFALYEGLVSLDGIANFCQRHGVGHAANQSSDGKGYFTAWAKSRGADFVVAIGDSEQLDRQDADIYIPCNEPLESAVEQIALKLRKLTEEAYGGNYKSRPPQIIEESQNCSDIPF